MAETAEVSPRIADIVGAGGTASVAGDLINAVYDSRPGPLLKATHLPHHARLRAQAVNSGAEHEIEESPKLDLAKVAKVAGLEEHEVVAAAIRGRTLADAWVVYVAEDARGAAYKGAFPFSDLKGSGKSKQHVSEAEAFAESEMGQRLADRADAQRESEAHTSTRRTRKAPAADDGDGADD
jgi:hypothetical protein